MQCAALEVKGLFFLDSGDNILVQFADAHICSEINFTVSKSSPQGDIPENIFFTLSWPPSETSGFSNNGQDGDQRKGKNQTQK